MMYNSKIDIVRGGTGKAVVLVEPDAHEWVRAAAEDLIEYVEKSTGARLPLLTEAELTDSHRGARIFIGYSENPDIASGLRGMGADGFIIRAKGDTVTIIGSDFRGTRYGVFEFLERYVGVRWLMPGPDGEDVPIRKSLSVPRGEVKQEPAFLSRYSTMFITNPVQAQWQIYNREFSISIFGLNHNMHQLFKPSVFFDSNPEFYSVSMQPDDSDNYSWQPNFSAPGLAEAAIKRIIQYFDENPDAISYSLGINDSTNFSAEDLAVSVRTNSVGHPDLSDVYYTWANKVAEGVSAVYPDKWLGLLAYEGVQDPPSFPLHPQLVPYITKDRMIWIDPEVKTRDMDLMKKWKAVCSNTGWYDYIYGTPYLLPRVYPHLMAEVFKTSTQFGVIAHYAENYTNWGEGPKPWVVARLRWNPDSDVDALLNEWYERTVGSAAAPDLKEYFAHWEDFWTERVKSSEWFESAKDRVYLPFNETPTYLELVKPEEIAESRRLLESVVAKTTTEKQRARAVVLLRAFEYYEASVYSYLGFSGDEEISAPGDEKEALALFDQLSKSYYYTERRAELIDEFQNDPVLTHPLPAANYIGTNIFPGVTVGVTVFWELVDYMNREQGEMPVSGHIRELAEAADAPRPEGFLAKALAAQLD